MAVDKFQISTGKGDYRPATMIAEKIRECAEWVINDGRDAEFCVTVKFKIEKKAKASAALAQPGTAAKEKEG